MNNDTKIIMSELIESQTVFLSSLLKDPNNIKKASIKSIKAIVEIVYNLYHNNVNLTDLQKSKLHKYKKIVLALLVKHQSFKEKKKILIRLSKTNFFKIVLEPVSHLLE